MKNLRVQLDPTRSEGSGYGVIYSNGKQLGHIYREVDGYYVFVFDEQAVGCWEAHVLREIADTLDEMNAPWDAEIKAHFENEKQATKGQCLDPYCDECAS